MSDYRHSSSKIPPGVGKVYLMSVRRGSFFYQSMIGRVEGNPQAGDIVAVLDRRGDLFGWAFWSPKAQMALRMLSHGGPMPDDAMFARRVAAAVQLRRGVLKLDAAGDAYRIIHAEGDGLPGLIADRYGDSVVIELFNIGAFCRLAKIQEAIVAAGLPVEDFVVRADKEVCQREGFELAGQAEKKDRGVVITENGVKFMVRLSRGHKTGFFCDQRENRLAVTAFTPGKSVLDVCCYTGGFSCYAATRGKASSVTAVDLDEVSLETAHENAKLNNAKIDFHHGDAFDFLRNANQKKKMWDVVVVDPSKFVPNQPMMEVGLRKYADLNRLASGVVSPGGILLTCSCSGLVDAPTFMQTVTTIILSTGRNLQILRTTGASPDHPVMADAPESSYLKAIWARVL